MSASTYSSRARWSAIGAAVAVGLATNVTITGPTSNTFVTLWGDGPNPGTSNLNPRAGGSPTTNSVNTPLSATGTFNIFNNKGTTNVIVDVNGYYAKIDSTSRFEEFIVVGAALTGNTSADPVQPHDGRFSFTDDIGACAHTPVDVPVGGSLDSIEIGWAATADFTIAGRILAYPTDPGTSALDAMTPIEILSYEETFMSPSGDISAYTASVSYNGLGDPDSFTDISETCSDDAVDLLRIRVRYTF